MINKLEFCADWLNFTGKHSDTRANIYEYAKGIIQPDWIDAVAVHGYQLALENRLGCRIMWHTRRAEMGIHIMYSGKCLNRYAAEGITALDILYHHAFFGDICKRVDLAIDAREMGLDIPHLYKLLNQLINANPAITTAKSWNLITGTTGDTLYVGSRTSEMFMRVYDKARQLGQVGDWKRIELEIKGSRAIQVARDFTTGKIDMAEYTRKLIAGYARFPDAVWREVVGDMVMMIGKAKDETPDTEKWLLSQVAPAMAKYMNATKNAAIVEKFLAVVHSLTDVDTFDNGDGI